MLLKTKGAEMEDSKLRPTLSRSDADFLAQPHFVPDPTRIF
jgi:hypothetical protein